MINRNFKDNFLSQALLMLALSNVLACGGGSDGESTPEVPTPVSFPEKISNITITDSLIFFSVEVDSGRYELYSTDPSATKLNGISDTLSATNNLYPYRISGDSSSIAYRADKDNNGSDELYTNLVDGSSEVQVSTSISTYSQNEIQNQVANYQWMPDSSRLIYRDDFDQDDIYEIQSVLVDGTELLELSSNLNISCEKQQCWKIANDSSLLLLKSEVINQGQLSFNLYAVTPTGNNLTQLNQPLATSSDIIQWDFSPDNLLISYISHNHNEPRELYTVNHDASLRTLINGSSLSLGVTEFKWAPDSSRIAFTEDSLHSGQPNLFSDLPDVTDRIQMIDTFKVSTPNIINWHWSPDSSYIAYLADQETAGVFELFQVQNNGEWHIKLSDTLPVDGVVHSEWQWSPNSDFIAYYSDLDISATYDELFVTSIDANQRNQINSLHSSKLKITNKHWLEDGSRLIYSTVDSNERIIAIYSVLPDGSQVIQLTNETSDNEYISDDYVISPDNSKLLYQISNVDSSTSKLQVGNINDTLRIDLGIQETLISYDWLTDSSKIVYVSQADSNSPQQLFSILPNATGLIKLY